MLYREELAQTYHFLARELWSEAQIAPRDREQLRDKARQAMRSALANYRAAVRIAPDDRRGLNYLAWTLATCALRDFRQPNEAIAHAEKLVSLAPQNASYWDTLGAAYYSNRQYEKAIEALNKSLMLINPSPDGITPIYSWYYLAACHGKLRNEKKARMWYDKAHDWTMKNRPANDVDEVYRLEVEVKEVLGLREGQ